MAPLLEALAWLATGALALAGGALARNRAALRPPPGPWRRLRLYLTRNVAVTGDDAPLPELRPRRLEGAAEELYAALREAMGDLGWTIGYENPSQLELAAVVTTPLFRFRDDVKVKLVPDGGHWRLFVRSASRVGRADFGANRRHILDLYAALARRGHRPR